MKNTRLTHAKLLEAQKMKLNLIKNFEAAKADYMEAINDTEELILKLERELSQNKVLNSNIVKYGRINII